MEWQYLGRLLPLGGLCGLVPIDTPISRTAFLGAVLECLITILSTGHKPF
jgi:hypothetical protein